jgi:hypothetical protein
MLLQLPEISIVQSSKLKLLETGHVLFQRMLQEVSFTTQLQQSVCLSVY